MFVGQSMDSIFVHDMFVGQSMDSIFVHDGFVDGSSVMLMLLLLLLMEDNPVLREQHDIPNKENKNDVIIMADYI